MYSVPEMGFCAPTLLRPAPSFRDGAFSGEMFADAMTPADTVTRSAVTKTAMVRDVPILGVSFLTELLSRPEQLESEKGHRASRNAVTKYAAMDRNFMIAWRPPASPTNPLFAQKFHSA